MDQNNGRKSRQDSPPEVDPKPEETAKLGIDLKSSTASKFLVPWELHPSPLTPFIPAAVPFKWEDAPGKPKKRAPEMPDRRSLHLPPRLFQRAMHPQFSPEDPDARHRRSGSAGSAEEKRVICFQPSETEKLQEDLSPGCLVSSLDAQGPKASGFITMWRKNSSKFKHIHTHNDNPKNKSAESFDPRDEEKQVFWVDESTNTSTKSLNAVIAVAMAAKTEDFDSSKEMTPSYPWGHRNLDPITGSYAYFSNLVENKRRKRKRRRWVLRKLRRPARVFKTFFGAVWRALRLGKSRHRSRGNQKLPYRSLGR